MTSTAQHAQQASVCCILNAAQKLHHPTAFQSYSSTLQFRSSLPNWLLVPFYELDMTPFPVQHPHHVFKVQSVCTGTYQFVCDGPGESGRREAPGQEARLPRRPVFRVQLQEQIP